MVRNSIHFYLHIFALFSFCCTAFEWTPFINDYIVPGADHSGNALSNIHSAHQQNDILIADTINEFIIYRLHQGQYSNPSGWGFPYFRPPALWPGIKNTGNGYGWTPFDRYGSLYLQRNRFPQLSALARGRLQNLGFQVRRLQIFDNARGIYVIWDIVDPTAQNDFWGRLDGLFSQRTQPSYGFHGGVCYLQGEDACRGSSDVSCRLQNFLDEVAQFFRVH